MNIFTHKFSTNFAKKMAEKPNVIFVLGGPGSGKGTLCSSITESPSTFSDSNEPLFVHLSAGELLRREMTVRRDTERGKLIDDIIQRGEIVPVKITVSLLEQAMLDSGWSSKTYLIDGFPRNQDNFDGWFQEMGEKTRCPFVLFIGVSRQCMVERVLERAKNTGSGEIRSDDNLEVLENRFRTFEETTMPIVNYFEKAHDHTLVRINGE